MSAPTKGEAPPRAPSPFPAPRCAAGLLYRAARLFARTLDGALLLTCGWTARRLPRRARPGQGICLVTNTMAVGGAQRQILLWLRRRRAGVPVSVVLLAGGGEWQGEVERLGVPLVVVEEELARSRWGRILLWGFPRTAYCLFLRRRFRQCQPQLVWAWL
ncbi:MAG: hypothetical protein N2447_09850, partial [Thermoanaerobaculum sp.]|nr:hypothetical protein [Thermoanaerobaculum sp.]